MISCELIELLKVKMKFTKDSDLVGVLPAATKSVVSELKSGKRHLTEDQAVFIAEKCELNIEWVIVNLAEEKSRNEKVKWVWASLAKKISKSAAAAALAISLIFCGFQTDNSASAVSA